MILGEPISFFFTSQGEASNQTWAGDFKVKPVLSFAGLAQADLARRQFMGFPDNENTVAEEIRNLAVMLSQVKARIVDAPSWYKDSRDLLDFVDSNTIIELFTKLMAVENEYRARLTKSANTALAEMKIETK